MISVEWSYQIRLKLLNIRTILDDDPLLHFWLITKFKIQDFTIQDFEAILFSELLLD